MLADVLVATNRAGDAEAPLRKLAETAGDAQSRLALADYYIGRSRQDEARPLLQELARTPEAFATATARLATLDYNAGRTEQAHALLDTALAKEPNNAQVLVLKGRWLLAEKKLDDALARAQGALKADPKYADAHHLVASVHMARREYDPALKSFLEVLRLNPRSVDAGKAVAGLELQAGRADTALRYAEDAAKAQPQDAGARLLLTRALLANGQVDRAAGELQQAMRTSESAEAHVLMGYIHDSKKDWPAARRSYERALELDPRATQALTGLVRLDMRDKQIDQAHRRVDQVVEKSPNDPSLLLLAARTYADTGDPARAETLLKRAIQADPSSIEAYGVLARIYVKQGKLDQARTEYEQLARKRPDDVSAQTMVGMILETQGRSAEARKAYEATVARYPQAAVASNNLAYMLAQEGTNLDRALNLAQVAKGRLPDDPDVNDTLGWVFYKKGLASLAIEPLEQSVKANPANPTFQYHLGFAYLKAGDNEKGRACLERALKLQPTSEMAAEARKALSS